MLLQRFLSLSEFVSQHTKVQNIHNNILQPDAAAAAADIIDNPFENSDLDSSLDDTENDGCNIQEFDDVIGDVR